MASAVHCLCSCLALPLKFSSISINDSSSSSSYSATICTPTHFRSLNFSNTLSNNVFSREFLTKRAVQSPIRRFMVCEAAPTKKADSAAKRTRQAEKKRIYNKSHKSDIKNRMKKC